MAFSWFLSFFKRLNTGAETATKKWGGGGLIAQLHAAVGSA